MGNNTLARFSHKTALTREATLKWNISYLQITEGSSVSVCVSGCFWPEDSHYTSENQFLLQGCAGRVSVPLSLCDKMFLPGVTSSSFSFPPLS